MKRLHIPGPELLPFVAIFGDILAWFLTRWDPFSAYTVVISGVLLGLAWKGQVLVSLYQTWILKAPEGNPFH